MIVVDTSALMAIVLGEAAAEVCRTALRQEPRIAISAGTMTELLIVAAARGQAEKVDRLLANSELEVVPVTEGSARRCAAAYARWGKGVHPARLNLGDCFAYELAVSRGAALLYVGRDFAQTDVRSALADADL